LAGSAKNCASPTFRPRQARPPASMKAAPSFMGPGRVLKRRAAGAALDGGSWHRDRFPVICFHSAAIHSATVDSGSLKTAPGREMMSLGRAAKWRISCTACRHAEYAHGRPLPIHAARPHQPRLGSRARGRPPFMRNASATGARGLPAEGKARAWHSPIPACSGLTLERRASQFPGETSPAILEPSPSPKAAAGDVFTDARTAGRRARSGLAPEADGTATGISAGRCARKSAELGLVLRA